MEKITKIFGRNIEQSAIDQFEGAMALECVVSGALMPDAHTGYTLPIGAAVAVKDHIFPSFIGYDIGCGMCALKTPYKLHQFDESVRKKVFESIYRSVPCGEGKYRNNAVESPRLIGLTRTPVVDSVMEKWRFQIGTLGGGNHFIEIGYDENEDVWIIIHSGSRGVGHKVATHYMELAKAKSGEDSSAFEKEFESLEKYAELKARDPEKYEEVKGNWIESRLKKDAKRGSIEGFYGFHVDSPEGKDYIIDMVFCLQFALENRSTMMRDVLKDIAYAVEWRFDGHRYDAFECLINRNHNHAEFRDGVWIHRKGATHADEGMLGVIPGNMRDGSFIVRGKGNPESLYSSSHGGGRVMSRKAVCQKYGVEEFAAEMVGITAKVDESTLDECPMAYKDIFEVMDLQKDLVEVLHHIRPIINVKG